MTQEVTTKHTKGTKTDPTADGFPVRPREGQPRMDTNGHGSGGHHETHQGHENGRIGTGCIAEREVPTEVTENWQIQSLDGLGVAAAVCRGLCRGSDRRRQCEGLEPSTADFADGADEVTGGKSPRTSRPSVQTRSIVLRFRTAPRETTTDGHESTRIRQYRCSRGRLVGLAGSTSTSRFNFAVRRSVDARRINAGPVR